MGSWKESNFSHVWASQHLRTIESVPVRSSLFTGIVPVRCSLFAGTVPVGCSLFTGTEPAYNLFLNLKGVDQNGWAVSIGVDRVI